MTFTFKTTLLWMIDASHTKLAIHMSYRVITQLNWYANEIAQLLIGNFEDLILDFYNKRLTISSSRVG